MVVCLPFSAAVKSWERFLLLLGYLCFPGSTVLSGKEIANTETQWKEEKGKDKNTSQSQHVFLVLIEDIKVGYDLAGSLEKSLVIVCYCIFN